MEQWGRVKYFSESENWGNPFKIQEDLVLKLNDWRELIGSSVIITSGTQGLHVEGSYHYKGMAADCVITDAKMHPLDMYIAAVRCGFKGIGYYNFWKYGSNIVPGFHLDVRTKFASWLGVHNPKNNSRFYTKFNYDNLTDYEII